MLKKNNTIKAESAAGADELFIAVSSKDIVPVVKFNEIQIADGKPGKYTKLRIEEFKNSSNKTA